MSQNIDFYHLEPAALDVINISQGLGRSIIPTQGLVNDSFEISQEELLKPRNQCNNHQWVVNESRVNKVQRDSVLHFNYKLNLQNENAFVKQFMRVVAFHLNNSENRYVLMAAKIKMKKFNAVMENQLIIEKAASKGKHKKFKSFPLPPLQSRNILDPKFPLKESNEISPSFENYEPPFSKIIGFSNPIGFSDHPHSNPPIGYSDHPHSNPPIGFSDHPHSNPLLGFSNHPQYKSGLLHKSISKSRLNWPPLLDQRFMDSFSTKNSPSPSELGPLPKVKSTRLLYRNFPKIFGQAVIRYIRLDLFSAKSIVLQIYLENGLIDRNGIHQFKEWLLGISSRYGKLSWFKKVWQQDFEKEEDRLFSKILTQLTYVFLSDESYHYFVGASEKKFKRNETIEQYLGCIPIFEEGIADPEKLNGLSGKT